LIEAQINDAAQALAKRTVSTVEIAGRGETETLRKKIVTLMITRPRI
jgi:hypothetical protein